MDSLVGHVQTRDVLCRHMTIQLDVISAVITAWRLSEPQAEQVWAAEVVRSQFQQYHCRQTKLSYVHNRLICVMKALTRDLV